MVLIGLMVLRVNVLLYPNIILNKVGGGGEERGIFDKNYLSFFRIKMDYC